MFSFITPNSLTRNTLSNSSRMSLYTSIWTRTSSSSRYPIGSLNNRFSGFRISSLYLIACCNLTWKSSIVVVASVILSPPYGVVVLENTPSNCTTRRSQSLLVIVIINKYNPNMSPISSITSMININTLRKIQLIVNNVSNTAMFIALLVSMIHFR